MKRLLLNALLLTCSAALADTEGAGPRIGVVPFAALSGDVPQRAGAKAAGMLSTELKNAEGVRYVEAKRPPREEPFKDALEQARSLVDEAKARRAEHKFRLAEESLRKALDQYRSAAAGLGDVAELQDAYVLLSAIQYNTGRDEEGQKSLATALGLAPTRELPLAKTSPLFARVVEDVRKQVQSGPKGSLLVESTPAGASTSVDGVGLGSTPLLIRDVPAGLHVWRVQLPSGDATGGMAEVSGGKTAKVNGQMAASDPESRVLATLAQNKLDPPLVAAAKEEAKNADADLLIFGALSREGKNLVLDSFVLDASSGSVRRLPRSSFDPELLSAGMELYNLAGEISHKLAQVGEPAAVPGPVAPGRLASASKVAEAEYGIQANKPELDGEAAPDAQTPEQNRAPLEPKKRKPLKR